MTLNLTLLWSGWPTTSVTFMGPILTVPVNGCSYLPSQTAAEKELSFLGTATWTVSFRRMGTEPGERSRHVDPAVAVEVVDAGRTEVHGTGQERVFDLGD